MIKYDSEVFKNINNFQNNKTSNKQRLKQIVIKNKVNKIIRAFRLFHERKNKLTVITTSNINTNINITTENANNNANNNPNEILNNTKIDNKIDVKLVVKVISS